MIIVNRRWNLPSLHFQAPALESDLPARFSELVDAFAYLRLFASCRIRVAVFETCLGFFPYLVLMLLPAGRQSSACLQAYGRLLTERVSAFADLQARMGLSAACGAFLLPTLANGLLDLRFRGPCGSQAYEPRLIRLLNGALGMHAAQGVGRFSANRAQMLRRRG